MSSNLCPNLLDKRLIISTTVVAVSASVIVIAALVIAAVLGTWWYRRQKRQRAVEAVNEPDYYGDSEWTGGTPEYFEKLTEGGGTGYDAQRW